MENHKADKQQQKHSTDTTTTKYQPNATNAPNSLSDRKPNEGIYRNPRFMNAGNTILGCPVLLKVKSKDTFHGIFTTFSPEFDVLLEFCHKVDPENEVVIYGRSLPRKSDVSVMYFERENIVEITACDVEKDFALKSNL